MFEWLLKRRFAKSSPTLIFFAGGWGKSMSRAAVFTVLKTAVTSVTSIGNVGRVDRALLTLGHLSLFRSLVDGVFAKPTPAAFCVELGRQSSSWPSSDALGAAGQILLVVPSLPQGEKAAEFVSRALAPFKGLEERLVVVYNADEPGMTDALAERVKTCVTYGIRQPADLQALNIDVISHGPEAGDTSDERWRGMGCKVNVAGSSVPLQLFGGIGRVHVLAGLSALAVSQALEMNMVETLQSLRAHSALAGRMSLIPGIKKSIIVDDTYDTDPATAALALQEAAALPLPDDKKRIAIIGEMPETGGHSPAAHCALGEPIAKLPFDMVIGAGERTTDLLSCANRAGMSEQKLFHFNDKVEAGKFVQHALRKGELVLIKGSARDQLESIVKELMAFPLKAKQDLLQR